MDITKDFDSISFNGKLTESPIQYVATLKNESTFTFTFGKKVELPVVPPDVQSTPLATATEAPVTKPSTSEQTKPTSESSGNQDSSEKNEQETNPTTSGGGMNLGSIAVIMLAIFKPFFTQ